MKSSDSVASTSTGAPVALAPPEPSEPEDALSASDLDEPITNEESAYMNEQHDMLSATLGAAILPHALRSSIVQYDVSRIRPSVRPTVGPSVHPSARPSFRRLDRPSVVPSDRPSDCAPVRSSARAIVRLVHPTIRLFVRGMHSSTSDRPSVRPTDHPSARLSVRPSARSA